MVDFYKMRGYPPIYSIEMQLELKSASWYPYGNRNVIPNTEPRTTVRRFAKPRSKGGKHNRYESLNCKVGDVVYSVIHNRYGRKSGSKNIIQPYVITEIDDCYMWSRKKITENKRGYCVYIWVSPLVKINGKWTTLNHRKRVGSIVGCYGHSVSINDEVFMTPEEAMWNEFRR